MNIEPVKMMENCEEVVKTVLYAKTNSEFYNKKLKDFVDFDQQDFNKLPFTTKQELAKFNPQFLAVSDDKVVEYVTTSGTSGTPVTVFLTKNDLSRLGENEAFSLSLMGGSSKDIYQIMLSLDKQFMAGIAYYNGVIELGAKVIRLGPGAISMQWDSILRNKPTKLIALPSFIPKLIAFAEENNIDYKNSPIDSVVCVGEPIRTSNFELNTVGKEIVSKWDVTLYSTYASTEMATAFSECKAQNGGHLNSNLLYLEVIDEAGNHVDDGEIGEVVITTLKVEGTPLIRYKTGDITTFHSSECSCGLTTPRIGPIIGRKNQLIKYKGTSIYPQAIINQLKKIKSIDLFLIEVHQIQNESDDLYVNLVDKIELIEQKGIIENLLKSAIKVTPKLKFVSENELRNSVFSKNKRKPNYVKFIQGVLFQD